MSLWSDSMWRSIECKMGTGDLLDEESINRVRTTYMRGMLDQHDREKYSGEDMLLFLDAIMKSIPNALTSLRQYVEFLER